MNNQNKINYTKATLNLMMRAFHNNHYIPEFQKELKATYNQLQGLEKHMKVGESTKYHLWMNNVYNKTLNSKNVKEKFEGYRNMYELKLEEQIKDFDLNKDDKELCGKIESTWGLYYGFSLQNKSQKYNTIFKFMKKDFYANFVKQNFGVGK